MRTLSKDNADGVARHLVMAGRLIHDDPELAYAHAQAAVRRAGRVDVVREAAALTAYQTGRYAEALRELRTVRRLNGSDEHLALMADCERGLGRPDRALALAQEDSVRGLPVETQVELAIVVSGARLDLGDPGAALAALGVPLARAATGELAERVLEARATALAAAGRTEEAAELMRMLPGHGDDEEDVVVVFDLEDESEDEAAVVQSADDDRQDDEPFMGTHDAASTATDELVGAADELVGGADDDADAAGRFVAESEAASHAGKPDAHARTQGDDAGGTLF